MDNFPAWTNIGDGFECGDDKQLMYAFTCEFMCGFDLPKFDLWAASLTDCPKCGKEPECCLKQAMREYRKLAIESLSVDNLDAAFRYLQRMLDLQRADMREQFLLPLARRGDKTVKSASKGGKAKAVWPDRAPELQAAIEAIHKDRPSISYEEIKRIANQRHGYPISALKRYTTNPKKIVGSLPATAPRPDE